MEYKEQRIHQRFKVDLLASYMIDGKEQQFSPTMVLNISYGGLCFTTQEQLSPGTDIIFKVELENEGEVTLKTIAIWSDKKEDEKIYKNGVKILETATEDYRKFSRFCNAKLIHPPNEY